MTGVLDWLVWCFERDKTSESQRDVCIQREGHEFTFCLLAFDMFLVAYCTGL